MSCVLRVFIRSEKQLESFEDSKPVVELFELFRLKTADVGRSKSENKHYEDHHKGNHIYESFYNRADQVSSAAPQTEVRNRASVEQQNRNDHRPLQSNLVLYIRSAHKYSNYSTDNHADIRVVKGVYKVAAFAANHLEDLSSCKNNAEEEHNALGCVALPRINVDRKHTE